MEFSATRKTLLRLLSEGRFCSGSLLARELGISRTSVWKHVGSLSELGLAVDAVSGRGYRLGRPLELLDEKLIRSGLEKDAERLIQAFFIHDRIDSTNRFLSLEDSGQGCSGAVCLAESQTSGKGRGDRTWVSPFGSNIYLSIAWRYPGGPATVSGLSLAIGVAVVRALSMLGVPELGLKWPNDILWNGKKLGGILIELSGESHGPCTVIIGLGLNYSMSPEEGAAIDQAWVDLDAAANGSKPGRNRLVAALLNAMLPAIAEYDRTGIAPFLVDFRAADCMRGREVVLHLGNREIAGKVAGISDDGLIQLCTAEGELHSYASGEVSFRPQRSG